KATAPFGTRTLIGPDWNIFDTIVGTGDVSGDGKADIVTRDSGGGLWLYPGTGKAAAPFGTRTLIGPDWDIYNLLF
ncbi:hypothetical protein ACGFMP_07275, partial [Streptomyces sp. NPDC049040]